MSELPKTVWILPGVDDEIFSNSDLAPSFRQDFGVCYVKESVVKNIYDHLVLKEEELKVANKTIKVLLACIGKERSDNETPE